MNVCADQGSYEFLTCSVGRREVVIEPLPIGPDEPGRGEHGDHRAEGGPQRQEENHHPRHDRPTQLETRTHGSELGGEPGAPGPVHCILGPVLNLLTSFQTNCVKVW